MTQVPSATEVEVGCEGVADSGCKQPIATVFWCFPKQQSGNKSELFLIITYNKICSLTFLEFQTCENSKREE